MWITDKYERWLVNTDNVDAFIMEGDITTIRFKGGCYANIVGDAIIPTVIMGIEKDSKVVYVGGDFNV